MKEINNNCHLELQEELKTNMIFISEEINTHYSIANTNKYIIHKLKNDNIQIIYRDSGKTFCFNTDNILEQESPNKEIIYFDSEEGKIINSIAEEIRERKEASESEKNKKVFKEEICIELNEVVDLILKKEN